MYENLRLDGSVLGDIADLVEIQLTRQHRPRQAELRRRLHAREIVYRHLGARVQGDVRQILADGRDEAQILDDDAVGPDLGDEPGCLKRGFDLAVVDQGIERDVDLAAADAAIAHRALKVLVGEILGAAPRVEVAEAHIDSVRAVLHRGDHSLGRTGGR